MKVNKRAKKQEAQQQQKGKKAKSKKPKSEKRQQTASNVTCVGSYSAPQQGLSDWCSRRLVIVFLVWE